MHAVLGNFMDAAGGWFLIEAIEMIERAVAFADRVALLDRFGDEGLSEDRGLSQLLT